MRGPTGPLSYGQAGVVQGPVSIGGWSTCGSTGTYGSVAVVAGGVVSGGLSTTAGWGAGSCAGAGTGALAFSSEEALTEAAGGLTGAVAAVAAGTGTAGADIIGVWALAAFFFYARPVPHPPSKSATTSSPPTRTTIDTRFISHL